VVRRENGEHRVGIALQDLQQRMQDADPRATLLRFDQHILARQPSIDVVPPRSMGGGERHEDPLGGRDMPRAQQCQVQQRWPATQ
jgi:hypothetical protein